LNKFIQILIFNASWNEVQIL